MPNLSWEVARGLEQVLMIYHHSVIRGNPTYNQINGVYLTNRFYNRYWFQAMDYLTNVGEELIYHTFYGD